MKKVSVIIPIYNMAHYIEQCLESVINQTLSDIEIICVDDCSTDNSLEILERYASKDNRFRIIKQDFNQGTGCARNLAINAAQGEYIMFVDPDDWIALDACEKAYNQIKKYDNDIVFFNYYRFDDKTGVAKVNEKYAEKLQTYSKFGNMNVRDNDIEYQGYSCTKIYKKDFLISNNCFYAPGRVGEDCPFAVITTIKANSISALNLPLYYYRVNITNKNRTKTIQHRMDNYLEVFNNRKMAYDIANSSSEAGNFRKIFNIFYINRTIGAFNGYIKRSEVIKSTLYKKVRNDFLDVANENDINEIKDFINYSDFKKFLKHKAYWMYKLDSIFKFSITYQFSVNGKHAVINILGLKIKFLQKVKNPKTT